MTTTDCTETSHPATILDRVAQVAEVALARAAGLWRAAVNRRKVARLLDWDERMLRDVGLTAGDVRSVMAVRFDEDPSLRLDALSAERRSAVRAAARERLFRDGHESRGTTFHRFIDL